MNSNKFQGLQYVNLSHSLFNDSTVLGFVNNNYFGLPENVQSIDFSKLIVI